MERRFWILSRFDELSEFTIIESSSQYIGYSVVLLT